MDPILTLLCLSLGAPTGLLMGGDVSMLARNEQIGAVYRVDGQPCPPLDLLRDSGWNCLRLRLFVAPNGRGGVVQDLPYTVALAKRARQAGFQVLLDLHYSDTWADPQNQTKPAAWAALSFEQLVAKVESYTAEVMAAFREAGALPESVQVGNEITPGLLWPDGRSGNAEALGALLRAGVRGVRRDAAADERVRIVIHADCGGDVARTKWFFDRVVAQGVPFDIVGLSYYPWWHGPLDRLKANMAACARAYGKPVWVVETAYPYTNAEHWSKQPNLTWPISPEGQRQFLADLAQAVREVPDGMGLGVLYWFPESIAIAGQYTWNGGATALFDGTGNRLPGALELRPAPTVSVLDPAALNFARGQWGTCINGQTFAQEAITTHGDRQYAVWYSHTGAVSLARRRLPDGPWSVVSLDDYRIDHTDVHNVAVLGLCPLDGTVHLAFDHHVSPLHYRRSAAGLLDQPADGAWTSAAFGPVTDQLVPGQRADQVTYPMFVTTPRGALQLLWRRGSSGDGDWHLAEYDPAVGGWRQLGLLLSRRGQYRTSDRRCAYPNPLRYDSRGRLHLTWCWREPGPLTSNHDLCHAYSDDQGRTWHNGSGAVVARLGGDQPSAIEVGTDGTIARPTPWHWGQMNTTTQCVDARNRVHVVNWQMPREAPAGGLDMNAWRYDHYWLDTQGQWREQRLPMAGRKPQMVVGADGTAFLVYLTGGDANYHNVDDGGLLTIATAPEASEAGAAPEASEAGAAPEAGGWREWRTLWQSRERYVGEPLLDQARWQREGVLSVYCQTKPGQPGAPSPLHVLDYAPASR